MQASLIFIIAMNSLSVKIVLISLTTDQPLNAWTLCGRTCWCNVDKDILRIFKAFHLGYCNPENIAAYKMYLYTYENSFKDVLCTILPMFDFFS